MWVCICHNPAVGRVKEANLPRQTFFFFNARGENNEFYPKTSLETAAYVSVLQMIILCEAQQFKVAVNGTHQLTYRHRVQDLSRVNELEITGDLQLLDVKMW